MKYEIELPDSPDSEVLNEILANQKLIISMLGDYMLVSGQRSVWKISDIAKRTGFSVESLRGKDRWMLPRFGESAFPSGPARWPVDECLEWLKRPVAEKQRAYAEHVRQRFAEEARKRRKATV